MNDIDLVFQRLQTSNPEPDPEALVRSLASPHRDIEGTTMTSDQITVEHQDAPAEPPTTRNPWLTAAVAAGVVVLAFIAIPTTPDSQYASFTDLEIATALAAGQIENPSEVVSEDATLDLTAYTGGHTNLDRLAQLGRHLGVQESDVSCVGDGPVSCTATVTTTISRALGAPSSPVFHTFTFRDGLITSWHQRSDPEWGGFFEWLSDEDIATMFTSDGDDLVLRMDDAALAAWEENVNAYANEVGAEALNPNEITTAFLEGTLEDPSRHFEPGFTWTESSFTGDAEDVTAWTQWVKAIGHQNENVDCSTGSAVIRCTWVVTTRASRALGLEPYTGYEGSYLFNSDNRITAISVGSSEDRVIAEFWTPFMQWLPSDRVSVMFADLSDDSFVPSLTDESIALWEESVNEWVATLEG